MVSSPVLSELIQAAIPGRRVTARVQHIRTETSPNAEGAFMDEVLANEIIEKTAAEEGPETPPSSA